MEKCLITFLNAKRQILLDLNCFRLKIQIYWLIYEKTRLKVRFLLYKSIKFFQKITYISSILVKNHQINIYKDGQWYSTQFWVWKKLLIFGPFLGPLGAQPNFQQSTIFLNGKVFDNLLNCQKTNLAWFELF